MTAYHVTVVVEMTLAAPSHEAAEERARGMVERALCQAAGVTDCVDDIAVTSVSEALA